MSGLPAGWVSAELDEVCTLVRGVTFPTTDKHYEPADGLIACLRTTNVQAQVEWDNLWFIPKYHVKQQEQNICTNDILISTANSFELVGKVARVTDLKHAATLGAFISLLRSENLINPLFLYYQMSAEDTQRAIRSMSSTTTNISNVSGGKLKTIRLALPPTAEQTRIVAKLDALLTELDAGVAQLKAAQKKLVQYRQSLLKAAVEGTLTAAWRAEQTLQQQTVRSEPVEGQLTTGGSKKPVLSVSKGSPRTDLDNETGEQLLARILTERRSRWQAKQLAKYAAQGKPPPKDWQSKYPEPVKPDTSALPALPQGWVWASVDCLLNNIETGKSFKCDERPPKMGEIGVVKVSAVSWGEYDEQESKTCTTENNVNPELFVKAGDFLFSRANTVELVGACVVARTVTLDVMLSDKILRLVLVQDDLKPWLLYLLRSQLGRMQIELLASGNQESMKNIGQDRIRSIAIPIGPHAEIIEAMRLAEKGFSQAALLRDNFETALKQSAAQRKNILKAAFAGELVPQDPLDEPASALLARIKADRDAQREHTSKSMRKNPRLMRGREAI
jgi:type I restriction enzyme S subunit